MSGSRKHEELPWYRWVFEVVRAAVEEFGADRAGRMGSALAFYTLFALVPLLFLASGVAGFLLGDGALQRLIEQAQQVVGGEIAGQMGRILRGVVESTGTSLVIGVALAAFSGSAIVVQVQRVLNEIFHAPEPERGGVTRVVAQRLMGVVVAVVLTLFVLTPIVAVAAVNFLAGLVPPQLGWLTGLLSLGLPLVSVGMLVGVVGVTFQLFTRHRIPWAAARRGGLFTALSILIAAYLIGTYLRVFDPTEGGGISALGVIGGVAILLFFFNLLWQVYLFGAEVTKVYADYLQHGDIVSPSERTARTEQGTARTEQRTSSSPEREESLVRVGLLGLALGLAIGWLRRPR